MLVHADGQYAPESLPDIVAPLESGEADAVFGSRMLVKGSARAGGMPAYKYVGNRVLTALENKALGSNLSEFHSGYRAYNVHTLAGLDLSATSDGFDFDTQIIIALVGAGKNIVEIPIPTFYGDEICYVNRMRYAADVLADVATYRLATMGFTSGDLVQLGPEYDIKESEGSSHRVILELLDGRLPSRILDVGCSGGPLAAQLRERDTTSVGSTCSRVRKPLNGWTCSCKPTSRMACPRKSAADSTSRLPPTSWNTSAIPTCCCNKSRPGSRPAGEC